MIVKINNITYAPMGEFDREGLWCDMCDLSISTCDLACKKYHCAYLRRVKH